MVLLHTASHRNLHLRLHGHLCASARSTYASTHPNTSHCWFISCKPEGQGSPDNRAEPLQVRRTLLVINLQTLDANSKQAWRTVLVELENTQDKVPTI